MEKKSRKRCGSCKYCKSIYEDNKYKFCNDLSSNKKNRIVTSYDVCCENYKSKYRTIPK